MLDLGESCHALSTRQGILATFHILLESNAGFAYRLSGYVVAYRYREFGLFCSQLCHAAWQSWGRKPFGLFEGGRPVGYGYAQTSGRLGPIVVERRELVLPLVAELMRQVEPLEDWMVHVPGAAAETFTTLLNAGMKLDGPPVVFCSSDETIDHSRYLPSSFALP